MNISDGDHLLIIIGLLIHSIKMSFGFIGFDRTPTVFNQPIVLKEWLLNLKLQRSYF